jgi:hypothetical protein
MINAATPTEIEARAIADYRHFIGKTFFSKEIHGYIGNDVVCIALSSPAMVVVQEEPSAQVMGWQDDWLDTNYPVVLVEPHSELGEVRSMWVTGHCYHQNGVQVEAAQLVAV